MVIVPNVQQVVPGIVIHCGDVLVGVGEGDVQEPVFAELCVVDVVDLVSRGLVVVVLVHGLHHVEDAADHEGVGGRALVVGRVPRALDAQRVGIELADDNLAVVLLRRIDHPKAVFIDGQVDV